MDGPDTRDPHLVGVFRQSATEKRPSLHLSWQQSHHFVISRSSRSSSSYQPFAMTVMSVTVAVWTKCARRVNHLSCMATPTKRRTCKDFSVNELCELLTPQAKLKAPDWGDWEMAKYTKTRRGQTADRAGLEVYQSLLKFILIACPSGRPSHVRLREVWLYLNNNFKIMNPDLQKIAKDVVSWSDEAVDRIKIMLRHLQDLRDSGSTFISPGIQELVSMIDDKDENGAFF